MRGLQDVSKLAAAAALVLGVSVFGTLGCSDREPGVDAAPPTEGELTEIDEMEIGGAQQEEEEEESQY